ncbi:nuclear transport factor 2 family protein [Rubrobacter indicoceani]|uniref:nuclear transport factor 2 family protein n=1 Tax=Rubrobacter indicoceani TaxID=2051957 RepID=UPI000E5BD8DF|nr:nuclear transport factor 2 family protein [Rubrobacter indicoceani]
MTDGEKVALVEAFYKARATGEVEEIRRFLADDVVWHEPDAGSEHTGDLTGTESVVAMISDAQRKTAGTFSLVPVRIVANGEHAVAMINWMARKGEVVIKGKEVAVFRIRAGEIREASFHQDNVERDREFWS